MQSEQINEVAAALAEAQAEFPPIVKDKTARVKMKEGGEYTYRYADLASVIEATRGALAKHGLATSQQTELAEGTLRLVTKLLHSSGQWLGALYPLKLYDRPQDMGSAITYARRYSLSGLLGIATEEDDDGNKASKRAATLSREQIARLWEAAKLKGIERDPFLALLKATTGVDAPAKILASSFDAIYAAIEKGATVPKEPPK